MLFVSYVTLYNCRADLRKLYVPLLRDVIRRDSHGQDVDLRHQKAGRLHAAVVGHNFGMFGITTAPGRDLAVNQSRYSSIDIEIVPDASGVIHQQCHNHLQVISHADVVGSHAVAEIDIKNMSNENIVVFTQA